MTKGSFENGVLTIALEGHIDSSNAPQVEADINKLCEEHPQSHIVLDMENLEYISSAGLRVVLRLRKSDAALKAINVSSSVYEILEMTGFTEMMNVEKAYRKLSVDGCEVIGQGANGVVYRLDADTIVKVYKNADALPDIHRERELARKAFVLGIPTAIPYDVAKVGDSYGSVFELLNAKSFAKLIAEEPEKLDYYIGLYVELLKKIHGTKVKPGDMPSTKEWALDWAEFLKDYLPENESNKLYKLINDVPETDHMMHGDYHMKNIMMQDGEVLLIDMDTLSVGHPIFELASMFLGFVGFGELDHSVTEKFMGLPYETTVEIWKKALKLYLDNADEEKVRSVEEKAMIVGYARLMRRTIRRNGFETEDGRKIIEHSKQKLSELLSKVDSLEF